MTLDAPPAGNVYDKYGTAHSIEQRLLHRFLRTLDAMLDGLAPRRILEVGTGEGVVLARVRARFPSATVVGVDRPDARLIDEWRRRRLPALFADATRLPFAAGAFDLVLAVEVLEHVPGPAVALDELARVGNATLIASVPFEPIWRAGNLMRRRYVRQLGNTPGHVNHWTRSGFRRFVAGRFDVERVANPLPWTMIRATAR